MKKEITDRIRLLGGNVANLKGNSLKEDLCAITFDTALFLKPVDTPWLAWMKNLAANCFGLPDHLRHSKKGHRILKNGMVGLRIMQSWVKSSSIQIVPLWIL